MSIAAAHTFSGIGVFSLNTSAGAIARLGVWDNNAGIPGNLILDTNTFSVTPGTGHFVTGLSLSLSQDLYWLGIVQSNLQQYRGFAIGAGELLWQLGIAPGSTVVNPTTGLTSGTSGGTPVANALTSNPGTIAAFEGALPLIALTA
jgi:hypothetical protein